MKKNVLVFPCGSEIGLEVYKSLKASTHFNVVGASSVDDHGEYIFEDYIGEIPFIDDPIFAEKFNEVIKNNDIDYVFPAHDSAVLKLAQLSANGQLACPVITSPVATCEIARSKAQTYETLKNVIPVPAIYSEEDVDLSMLPVFLKPNVGQGSKGTYLARTIQDIQFYREKDPTLLILEYLPGKEFTIDCFTSRSGELLICQGRERKRINNGISVSSSEVVDERFEILAKTINNTLKFEGVWFFQVKENVDGELVLLEIAPRIAGTMGLIRCLGVNMTLLSLFEAEGYSVDIVKNDYQLTIDRALENKYKHSIKFGHVYLDFDDMVIINGKVNLEVMAFVFQCRNDGIPVHLLTRHEDDLNTTLQKFRLNNIFDELIWVRDDTPKHQYIVHEDAIFIDDSYAERRAVHEALGVPVFDAHMIEALIH